MLVLLYGNKNPVLFTKFNKEIEIRKNAWDKYWEQYVEINKTLLTRLELQVMVFWEGNAHHQGNQPRKDYGSLHRSLSRCELCQWFAAPTIYTSRSLSAEVLCIRYLNKNVVLSLSLSGMTFHWDDGQLFLLMYHLLITTLRLNILWIV